MLRIIVTIALVSIGACSDAPSKSNNGAGDAGVTADASATCENVSALISERTSTLPVDCEVDEDCAVDWFNTCECRQAHRQMDDPELDGWREIYGECPITSCDERESCVWDGWGGGALLSAGCVSGECVTVPGPDCAALASPPPDPNRCQADSDCEVRTDTNICGCPTAYHRTTGAILARSFDLGCPMPEECALIDCAAGESATCSDGICVMTTL